MKLRIRNFQSIEDAKLVAAGFTAITGKSNTGKTALTRAIAATLFGLAGEHFVRRGTDWAGAHLALEDDPPLRITWRKVPAAKKRPGLQSVLQINGTTHTKTATPAQHKLLTAAYGVKELETGGNRLRPQTAAQHDPIFLATESEANAAEVLKLLGRGDTVNEAQQLARKDKRTTETRRLLRQEDEEKARTALDELAGVPQLAVEWAQLRQQQAAAELRQQETANLWTNLDSLRWLEPRILPPLPPPPKDEISEKLRLLGELEAEEDQIKTSEAKRSILEMAVRHEKELIDAVLETMERCPTCGRPLDHDH